MAAFAKKYIYGMTEPTSPALIAGLAFHEMAKFNFRQKKDSGGDLGLFELKEILINEFFLKWDSINDRLKLTEKDEEIGEDKIKQRSIDCLLALVPLFYDRAHSIMPIDCERQIEIEIDGLPKKIKGILDLYHKTAVNGFDGSYVTDFKTSIKPCNWRSRSWALIKPRGKTPEQAWKDFGLTFYWVLVYSAYGHFPDAMFYDNYMAWINEGESAVQTAFKRVPTYRTTAHITAIFERIRTLHDCIEKMAFYPCPPDDFLCSPDFCGFYGSCEFVWGEDDSEYKDCSKCRNFTGGHRLHCAAKDEEIYNTITPCNLFKKPLTKTELKAIQKKAGK